MSISRQGIPLPALGPGPQRTYAELLEDFPELTEEINNLTSVYDVGSQDGRSKSFERQFPSLKPRVRDSS